MTMTRTLAGHVIMDCGEEMMTSVRPSSRGFDVMQGQVVVASFADQHVAFGYARRLFEACTMEMGKEDVNVSRSVPD